MADVFLSYAGACERTTLTIVELTQMIGTGGFPDPIEIAPSTWGWRESDVDAWIDARPIAENFLSELDDQSPPQR